MPRRGRSAGDSAELFGYAAAFADALAGIGQIIPEEFAARFPGQADYLPRISWDPTQAAFWDEFKANPAVVNQDKAEGEPGYRTFDCRLNPVERARLGENGFVVSKRFGRPDAFRTPNGNPAGAAGSLPIRFRRCWMAVRLPTCRATGSRGSPPGLDPRLPDCAAASRKGGSSGLAPPGERMAPAGLRLTGGPGHHETRGA